jgi:hypothetical protein
MTLHVTTKVLPGKRIEISAAELSEGQDVEVTITPVAQPAPPRRQGIMEFIRSLPPGPRSAQTWEEVERQFQEERDAWER